MCLVKMHLQKQIHFLPKYVLSFLIFTYLLHLSRRCHLSSLFGPWVSTRHKAGWIRIIRRPLSLTWWERGTTIQKDVPKFWRRDEQKNIFNWLDASLLIWKFQQFALWALESTQVPECCRLLLLPFPPSGVLCFSWFSLCSNVPSLTLWVPVLPRRPRASPEPIRGSVAPLAL